MTCSSHHSLQIHYSILQITDHRLYTTYNRLHYRQLTDDLHDIARQCVALVFCDGYADDLYTRQFDDRSRPPADVAAEKVDVGTTVDVPIVR